MRKFFTVAGLILLLCANTDFAQKKLGFEFDYARFKLDENSVYLELYYDIKVGDFTQAKAENGFMIKGNLHIEITDKKTNQAAYNKDFPFEEKFANDADVNANNKLGVLVMPISKGEYTIKVVVEDFHNRSNSKTINEDLSIVPFDDKTSSLSDIQLAAHIMKEGADKSSIFYKSGMEITPNPAMLYSNKMPILHYYLELYNLADDKTGKVYKVVKTLFNSRGKLVSTSAKQVSPKLNTTVDIGNLNLSKLPTDNYTLEIAVVDTVSKKAQMTTKRLFLLNPNVAKEVVAAGNSNFMGSEYSVMADVDCDKMLDQIKYLAAPDELEQMKKLDTYDGKKQFLFNFWVSRNNNISSGTNDSRVEFDKRIQYVTKNFTYKYKEGYKTDRGRIIIKYGTPDDIDRHPSEPNTQPYEIWTYNNVEQEPNVTFVFADISGFGNYILMHSTKRNEVFDDQWLKRIQKY